MDTKAMVYFSSMNPLARKFVSDSQMVEKILGDKWEKFDVNEKEEVLDDFFVRPEVRQKYDSQEKKYNYPESFPKLNIQSGEKIVIDDANDSQQDLSLLDIDELSKPNAKTSKPKKSSEDENAGVTMAKREFKYDTSKRSLWEDFFPQKLQEYEREIQHDDTEELIGRARKESHSRGSPSISRKDSNKKALNGSLSLKNGTTRREIGLNIVSNNTVQGQQPMPEPQSQKTKLKSPKSSKKSPKLSLSSSFSKKKDGDGENLVTKVKESQLPKSKSNSSFSSKEEDGEELNAFDNPLMSSGVSSLVQEEEDYSSSNTSSPSRKPLLKEPRGQRMDREPLQMRGLESLSHNEGFVNSELLAVADTTKSSSEVCCINMFCIVHHLSTITVAQLFITPNI
ncbi:hypothetical protein FSP39_016138 [Pinctada imbricata]|uniref:DUF4706 domain-containing protein n=1 Tax=Pinctada imbricata TaxID=66713 RepID=A0AA88Y3P0_PINIB|nr:hypothetical protein FSP39_016138 [Pinctada imbricata]